MPSTPQVIQATRLMVSLLSVTEEPADSPALGTGLPEGRDCPSLHSSGQGQGQCSPDTTRFTALRSTALDKYCIFFYKLKVCSNPLSSKSVSTIFPTVFHFIFLSHISVILAIFQTFSLLYLLWWSGTFDVTITVILAFFSDKLLFSWGMYTV